MTGAHRVVTALCATCRVDMVKERRKRAGSGATDISTTEKGAGIPYVYGSVPEEGFLHARPLSMKCIDEGSGGWPISALPAPRKELTCLLCKRRPVLQRTSCRARAPLCQGRLPPGPDLDVGNRGAQRWSAPEELDHRKEPQSRQRLCVMAAGKGNNQGGPEESHQHHQLYYPHHAAANSQ